MPAGKYGFDSRETVFSPVLPNVLILPNAPIPVSLLSFAPAVHPDPTAAATVAAAVFQLPEALLRFSVPQLLPPPAGPSR